MNNTEQETPSPLTQVLTGKDNKTHDIIRHLGLAGCVWFLIAESYIVIHTGNFDVMTFGTAFPLLLVGIGGALKIKETTEPDSHD
jgi:hypothetical protein